MVFQKDVVDTLLAWTNAIRIVGGSLAVILAFDSLLIIMTVIGMKIALKREEIEILNLVGASPWYIRMPFVLEGGMYGVAARLAWMIITGLIHLGAADGIGIFGYDSRDFIDSGELTSCAVFAFAGGFMAGMIIVGFILGSDWKSDRPRAIFKRL